MKFAGIVILGFICGIVFGKAVGGESIGFIVLILFTLLGIGVSVFVKIQDDAKRKGKNEEKLKLLNEIKPAYLNSLGRLKSQPTNADLKQNTLELGREYSERTRKLQGINGITIFDEMALMNDINTACAGATSVSMKEATNNQTILERLSKLSELKDKNLINEQEYETRRLKILDEI